MSIRDLHHKQEALIAELKEKVPSQEVTIEKYGEGFSYTLPGFYKSGEVILVDPTPHLKERGVVFLASSRYNRLDPICDFDDLVNLNGYWFHSSCNKTWKEPQGDWEPHLLEAGFVKKETITIYSRT